jgi:hypothetical protein
MNIKVVDLIREALIGGRNGEMAYIYNNPFIFELYNQWRSKEGNWRLYQNNDIEAFKGFLKECLEEDTVEPGVETPKVIGYKTLTKEYDVSTRDENFKEWEKLEDEIKEKRHKQRQLVEAIAKSKNETLAEISTLELNGTFMKKKIIFKFSVEAILEDKPQEEK